MTINIDKRAYGKIMLHCIKHNTSDCIGVLIGKESDGTTVINDVVPLFHDRVFAPQLEVALKFVYFIKLDRIISRKR